MTEPPLSPRWSGEAKAWLVFFVVLVVATPILLIFFPEWFTWDFRGPQRRGAFGRRVPTADELPAIGLLLAWLVGVGGWTYWYRNKRRSAGLAGIAQELKLELTPAPEDDAWSCMGVFAFFRIGFEHSGRNWMAGKLGRYSINVLDYHFRRSALPRDVEIQMSSRKYHQTVVAFWDVARGLPNFQLVTRESWWSRPGENRSPKGCIADRKIGRAVNDDFLKNYKVGGGSEARLSEFFTPLLMEYFCAHKGWDVEAVDGHLLIYQERRLQAPANMAAFLEQARHVADTLRERAEETKRR
jgi:hypothetical protein